MSVTTTETLNANQFIDDITKFMFEGTSVSHDMDATSVNGSPAGAILHNINSAKGWADLTGDKDFDWIDYFLCKVNEGLIHPKYALEFLNVLNGKPMVASLNQFKLVFVQRNQADQEGIKFIESLYGSQVSKITQRCDEKIKQHQDDDKYNREWRGNIRRIREALKPFKVSEISRAADALKQIGKRLKTSITNRQVMIDQHDEHIKTLVDLEAQYLKINPEVPELVPSSNTYKGEVTITIDTESAQRWASALSWFSSREELNQALHQLMVETGELIVNNKIFTEGKPDAIKLQKDGYMLGSVKYDLVCKTCGKAGGGNCPDCGTCAGYSE